MKRIDDVAVSSLLLWAATTNETLQTCLEAIEPGDLFNQNAWEETRERMAEFKSWYEGLEEASQAEMDDLSCRKTHYLKPRPPFPGASDESPRVPFLGRKTPMPLPEKLPVCMAKRVALALRHTLFDRDQLVRDTHEVIGWVLTHLPAVREGEVRSIFAVTRDCAVQTLEHLIERAEAAREPDETVNYSGLLPWLYNLIQELVLGMVPGTKK